MDVWTNFVRLDFFGLDSDLALYLLLSFCAISLWSIRGMSISWSWTAIVRSLILAALIIIGLVTNQRSVFAAISWIFFVVAYIVPLIIVRRYTKQILRLDIDRALKLASLIKYSFWGKAGEFYYDSTLAFKFYLEGNKDEVEGILGQWRGEKVPIPFQQQLTNARFQGYSILKDWQQIIREYEFDKQSNKNVGQSYVYASRAYIELNDYNSAADCLILDQLPRTRNEANFFALALFCFFCSIGSAIEAEQVLAAMADNNYPLADYVKNYWLGRLALVQQKYNEAVSLFDKAILDAPSYWKSRIEPCKTIAEKKTQDSKNDEAPNKQNPLNPEKLARVKDIWTKLKQILNGLQIIYPPRNSRAVLFLISSMRKPMKVAPCAEATLPLPRSIY